MPIERLDNTCRTIPRELLNWFETLPGARSYQPKETIYLEGAQAVQFYYLKKGRVRVYVTSGNGIQKVLTIYRNHTVFGEASFFDGMPRMTSAEAIEPSEIVVVSRDNILSCFKEQPALALAMIQSLSKTVRMLSTQIHQMSFLSADKRIIQFLLLENAEKGSHIPYTQEELGNLAGCSRVTVSRTLKMLEKAGALTLSYGGISVIQPDMLKKYLDN